jgi:hypothetical protein
VVATGLDVSALDGIIALGTAVGFFVGTGTTGVGFWDAVGGVDATTVGVAGGTRVVAFDIGDNVGIVLFVLFAGVGADVCAQTVLVSKNTPRKRHDITLQRNLAVMVSYQ